MESSTEDLGPAEESVLLPSVNPVEDVEESVKTKGCHVVRGDILDDSDFIQHYDLWDECETLKP